jgi:hypothetical protein
MAKRKDPVGRARGRAAAPVKKPFPIGFALGSAALAAVLIGILVFAAQHQGLGDKSSLVYARSQISGIINTDGLGRNHTESAVNYPGQATMPPVGGNHNPLPESCQVYTQPIANEHAVHSLEHGAVWVTYNPDKVSAADIAKLKSLVNGNPFQLMSPYPGLKSAISLQAWGEQVFLKKASDSRVKRFLELFTTPAWNLEPGKACTGTTATGPLAPVAPAPSASPTPSPSATK